MACNLVMMGEAISFPKFVLPCYCAVITAAVLPGAAGASRTVGPLWNAICSGSDKSHCLCYSHLQQLPGLTSVMAVLLDSGISEPRTWENWVALWLYVLSYRHMSGALIEMCHWQSGSTEENCTSLFLMLWSVWNALLTMQLLSKIITMHKTVM